jgi:hypothetical protein
MQTTDKITSQTFLGVFLYFKIIIIFPFFLAPASVMIIKDFRFQWLGICVCAVRYCWPRVETAVSLIYWSNGFECKEDI